MRRFISLVALWLVVAAGMAWAPYGVTYPGSSVQFGVGFGAGSGWGSPSGGTYFGVGSGGGGGYPYGYYPGSYVGVGINRGFYPRGGGYGSNITRYPTYYQQQYTAPDNTVWSNSNFFNNGGFTQVSPNTAIPAY